MVQFYSNNNEITGKGFPLQYKSIFVEDDSYDKTKIVFIVIGVIVGFIIFPPLVYLLICIILNFIYRRNHDRSRANYNNTIGYNGIINNIINHVTQYSSLSSHHQNQNQQHNQNLPCSQKQNSSSCSSTANSSTFCKLKFITRP